MKKLENKYNGVLLVNKPGGITSHDVVVKLRKMTGQRRIGHTGTLDKRATGLLIVCFGSATKLTPFLAEDDKVYLAELFLGRTSNTYDGEGVDLSEPARSVPQLNTEQWTRFLNNKTGRIVQTVPPFSALHRDGQRLYKLARRGIEFEPPEREVTINNIELIDYTSNILTIRVNCTKGTYIRSLAHDFGHELGCGAYLSGLVREAIGCHRLENALELEAIETTLKSDSLEECFVTYDRLLTFGALKVTDEFGRHIREGRQLLTTDVIATEGRFKAGDTVMLKDSGGQVLALGKAEVASTQFVETDEQRKLFSYLRVLN